MSAEQVVVEIQIAKGVQQKRTFSLVILSLHIEEAN